MLACPPGLSPSIIPKWLQQFLSSYTHTGQHPEAEKGLPPTVLVFRRKGLPPKLVTHSSPQQPISYWHDLHTQCQLEEQDLDSWLVQVKACYKLVLGTSEVPGAGAWNMSTLREENGLGVL